MRKLTILFALLTLSAGLWAEVPANVESVDLGLPSGLKWANMNVGATTPEGYGDYFAWGETEPKTTYDWSTYKWCNGSSNTQTKYCVNSSYGTVDHKVVLELVDDAAAMNWGGNWRMPTKAEQDELRDENNCTWKWETNYNGTNVNGYLVTSRKNGNTIFLPASGSRNNSSLLDVGSYGGYWSSSLYGDDSNCACYLLFDSYDEKWYYISRYYGRSVRPVIKSIVPTALPTPASNQIIYRSSDHQKITPYKTDVFGATYNDAQSTYNQEADYGVITFDGTITTIGDYAFLHKNTLAAIVWPSTMTSIGNYAFQNCTNLSHLDLQEGVTSIGDDAFNGCVNLSSFNLPEGVTSIGEYAFNGCAGMAELTIPSTVTSIGNYAFKGWQNLTKLTVKAGSLGAKAFSNCTNLSTIDLLEGVTSIGDHAFVSCAGQAELTIPSTVTNIGTEAFTSWTSLTKLTVKAGSIGMRAFRNCTNLSTINLQEGVTSIGDHAFVGCAGQAELTIPSTVTNIGTEAFSNWTSLTKLTVKAGSIGMKAFLNCTNLSTIDLQEGVTSIGDWAFVGCVGSTELIIPSTVNTIGKLAFSDDEYSCWQNLIKLTIKAGSIGKEAFSGLTSLTELTIKAGSIGENAFQYCTNLSTIDLQEGVTSIGDDAFVGCAGISELILPSTVTNIAARAFQGCQNLTKLTVKAGSLGANAFLNCTNLSHLDLLEGVTSIGDDAFVGCAGQAELTIPSTVTNIAVRAFQGWQNLTKLTVKAGNISGNAFKGCTNLSTIDLQDGVTSIGDGAFDGCVGIETLIIPSTITSIGNNAFGGCTNVVSVKFLGYMVLNGGSFNTIGTVESPANLQIPSTWLASDKPVDSETPWHGGYFNCTYEKTASELLGAMAEPCVGCTAVKVSDGETTVILYAPKTIEYIKAVAE